MEQVKQATRRPRRPRHRQDLRGRVPGDRPAPPLPATDVWRLTRLAGSRDIDAQTLAAKIKSAVTATITAPSTKRSWRPHTGNGPASKPGSNATASSHWSHGSADTPQAQEGCVAHRPHPGQAGDRPSKSRPFGSAPGRCEPCEETGKVMSGANRGFDDEGPSTVGHPAVPRTAALVQGFRHANVHPAGRSNREPSACRRGLEGAVPDNVLLIPILLARYVALRQA